MKRPIMFLLSILSSFVLLWVAFVDGFRLDPYLLIGYSIVLYISMFVVFERDIVYSSLVTSMLFPVVFVDNLIISAVYIISSQHISNILRDAESVIFAIVIFILTNAVISIMNIFNVGRYRNLPLLEASRSLLFLFSIIGGTITSYNTYHFFEYIYVGQNMNTNSLLLNNVMYSIHTYIVPIIFMLISIYYIFIYNWGLVLRLKNSISIILYTLIIYIQYFLILDLFNIKIFFVPVLTSIFILWFNVMKFESENTRIFNRAMYLVTTLFIIITAVFILISINT